MVRLILSLLFTTALSRYVCAQQSDPFAPAQPLAGGWEKMDERLIFLMVRLVDVEANLEAVDLAIAKSSVRAGGARSAASRAEAGNDRMDRRAGGPVRWDQFYGRTAEKFFYHPTENHTYHTQTILSQQSPSNDTQGETGVPSRQGVPVHQRPPQFDYMYRANENAKERATAEVAKIANKVEALAARRAELELEQSKLWCDIAFRVVSRNDLDKKPVYRFMPKGSGQESLTAAASFVVVALSIVKSGESDQGGAFQQLKPMVSKARSDLGDKWLQMGVKYTDETSDEWKFAMLARYLEDVSSNLSDSYAVSIESARNSDNERRDMYRGLLQKSLKQYAQAVLALNEMATEMANAKGYEPDLQKPIAMQIDNYARPKPVIAMAKDIRTGSLADLIATEEVNGNGLGLDAPKRPRNVPSDAVYMNGKWYWFSRDKVSFREAFLSAAKLKGRLLNISSLEENELIAGHLSGSTWIGIVKQNGRWITTNESQQAFFNWDQATRQPSSVQGENWAAIFKSGKWGDYLEFESPGVPTRLFYVIEWVP